MSQHTPALDFNHPWSEMLYVFDVQREQWNEFFEKYGTHYSSNISKDVKDRAFVWILAHSKTNYGSTTDRQ